MSLEGVNDLEGMKRYLASLKYGETPDLDAVYQRLTVLEECCKEQPAPKSLTKKELQAIAKATVQEFLKELTGE